MFGCKSGYCHFSIFTSRAAVVHLNLRAGSTFQVPVCTESSGHWVIKAEDYSRCNKFDAVRLYTSYRLNLLLLKGQKCVLQASYQSRGGRGKNPKTGNFHLSLLILYRQLCIFTILRSEVRTFCYVIRVSNVIYYSLTRNHVQLCEIIYISCNFAGIRVIDEISIPRNYGIISRNFYREILRNFVIFTRN